MKPSIVLRPRTLLSVLAAAVLAASTGCAPLEGPPDETTAAMEVTVEFFDADTEAPVTAVLCLDPRGEDCHEADEQGTVRVPLPTTNALLTWVAPGYRVHRAAVDADALDNTVSIALPVVHNDTAALHVADPQSLDHGIVLTTFHGRLETDVMSEHGDTARVGAWMLFGDVPVGSVELAMRLNEETCRSSLQPTIEPTVLDVQAGVVSVVPSVRCDP